MLCIVYYVSMFNMTEDIRTAVRVEMAKRNWNQTRLADETDLSKQFVSYLMNGGGEVNEGWRKIFNTLGLELTVKPKEG